MAVRRENPGRRAAGSTNRKDTENIYRNLVSVQLMYSVTSVSDVPQMTQQFCTALRAHTTKRALDSIHLFTQPPTSPLVAVRLSSAVKGLYGL